MYNSIESLAKERQGRFKLLASNEYVVDPDQEQQFFKGEKHNDRAINIRWDKEIQELESFFSNTELPKDPFYINPYSPVGNALKFIEYNLGVARAQNEIKTYRPYLDRVIALKQYLDDLQSQT